MQYGLGGEMLGGGLLAQNLAILSVVLFPNMQFFGL